MNMKNKSILRLSYLAIFMILLLAGCEKDAFGKDMEVPVLPTNLSYSDIIGAREFGRIESSPPSINSNGHPVSYEIVSIKKGDEVLDASYIAATSIVNPTIEETEVDDTTNPGNSWTVNTSNLQNAGKVIIEEGNPFANGEYLFTIKATVTINYAYESVVFEDVLRLVIGPDLLDGIAYCPFNMNFVSGENTASNPADLFGGNIDVRFELGTESDKLSIDPVTGVLSANSSYTITGTEVLRPVINVISNVSEEVVSFENQFTATLSTAALVLDRETNYFYFPSLAPTSRQSVFLGGPNYDHQVIDYHTLPTNNWFNRIAHWRAQRGQNWVPDVETADAVAVRADANVSNKRTLEHPFWTINAPTESWLTINEVDLTLYEGCFDSKVVFWYKLNLANAGTNAGYELDGTTPIGLEAHITTNYTGDVTTTDWTQVNDILECEIDNNGTIFTGTPYPGDQTGLNPGGVKDPTKNANNLWVRAELDLTDYKTETNFVIAFRLKSYYEVQPYSLDVNGNPAVNGGLLISNVHYVATEK